MLESCRLQGVARRGGRGPRYHGGNTGVDVAANMRRDGWSWSHPARDAVRGGAGLRRSEIVMLNSFRRLLGNITTLNADIGKWAGTESLPQPSHQTRINMFQGRGPGGPPTGINECASVAAGLTGFFQLLREHAEYIFRSCFSIGAPYMPTFSPRPLLELCQCCSFDDRSHNLNQADLYASPSMAGARTRMGTPTGSHVSDYAHLGGQGAKTGPFSDAGTRHAGSPGPRGVPTRSVVHSARAFGTRHFSLLDHSTESVFCAGAPPSPPGAQGPLPIGGHSGDPGLTPFGVNFAQLNQEVRHIYSFAVIETAKRIADSVLRDSGGMQRIVDSAASVISPSYHAPYAVGPAQGDARVTSAQRLHDGLLALLTGTRRVLEDKAFVALARGIWDHIGSVAHMAIENLQNGAEDPVRP